MALYQHTKSGKILRFEMWGLSFLAIFACNGVKRVICVFKDFFFFLNFFLIQLLFDHYFTIYKINFLCSILLTYLSYFIFFY